MSAAHPSAKWDIPEEDSLLYKAQENFTCAELARESEHYDVEASRIYCALHNLACELVRKNIMRVRRKGKNATPERPYRLDHGSYDMEIQELIGRNADYVYTDWRSFRIMADYEHERISHRGQWQATIQKKRAKAWKVAEAIYDRLTESTRADR